MNQQQFDRQLAWLNIEPLATTTGAHDGLVADRSKGADLRDVMELLGHSQIALTANTYGHIFSDRKKKLAQAMGDLLAPQETVVAQRVN